MNTKRMYELLLELAKVPSVSPSAEEARIAKLIHSKLASEPYFQSNVEQLRLLPIEGDRFGRYSVYAMVRAVPRTSRTIVLIGHMDVVETREARDMAELAFDPEEYTRQLFRRMLPQSARLDLESGHFLFGRGVFDMKCGVAAEVELIREASLDPASLECNLMLLIVGDEENQSAGMLSAVEHLLRVQEEEGLDFVACVNTEGETQKFAGDSSRYVSLGTIGKMMPVFYCVGRESHVGSHYEGLNANLLASAVNMVLEGSPEWVDKVGSEVYPPPTALKHRDLRDAYSVTLPARAVTYFNYLFVNKTPGVALEMMKTAAQEAWALALERMRYTAGRFAAKAGSPVEIPWRPKVITYQELVDSVRSTFGTVEDAAARRDSAVSQDPGKSASASVAASSVLDTHLRSFIDGLPKEMDARDKCVAVIGEVLRHYEDKEPLIIVGFLPPFYPHRTNLRSTARELGILQAVEDLVTEAKELHGETLKVNEHFVAISDLSYVGFHGTREDMQFLVENTPGWGDIYGLPVDALLKLDIPVLNIGPSGRDAHKFTERLDLRYYMGAYPKLLESMVRRISRIP